MAPCCNGSIELWIYNPEPPKIKRKPPENIRHVTFSNKAIKMISLPAIFDRTNIKSSFITNKCNVITFIVFPDLTAPIRSNIFNLNNFAYPLCWLVSCSFCHIACKCDKYPFIDEDHGHVFMRHLTIIKNNKLKNIRVKIKSSSLVWLEREFSWFKSMYIFLM